MSATQRGPRDEPCIPVPVSQYFGGEILRLREQFDAERRRREEAEALLREVLDEFGPGCRDFSTWDTVEDFLDHREGSGNRETSAPRT